MTDWITWFALAGALVILEMFTGTFYLLMIGLGLAAGGLAALAGLSPALQFVAAALVGVVATVGLRRSRWGKINKTTAARDANVNLDIGETVAVSEWSQTEGVPSVARVMYRGAMWDVELEAGATARAGSFIIREMRGNRLIVANSNSAQ
jgi:membrane protein implicated in regulation of membrane protease activity